MISRPGGNVTGPSRTGPSSGSPGTAIRSSFRPTHMINNC